MYKKQIGQQILFLLSVVFNSCFFKFVQIVCNVKKYYTRA